MECLSRFSGRRLLRVTAVLGWTVGSLWAAPAGADPDDPCSAAWPPGGTTLDTFELPGTEIIDFRGRVGQASPGYRRNGGFESGGAIFNLDVCFIGRVEDVAYRCWATRGRGRQSLAFVQFEVMTRYWGITTERIVVPTPVSNRDNCVEYRHPRFERFTPGELYLVIGFARYIENHWKSRGLYRLEDGAISDPYGSSWNWEDVAPILGEHARRRRLDEQYRQADVVAIIRTASSRERFASPLRNIYVEEVLKGAISPPLLTIEEPRHPMGEFRDGSLCGSSLNFRSYAHLAPDTRCLVFLEVTGHGSYQYIFGKYSVLEIRDECVYTVHDVCKGPLADIVAAFPATAAPVDPQAPDR